VNVRLLEVAQQELDEAISYYNTQVAGLGDAFLLEAVAAVERIRRFPEGWHPLSENVRRCRLRRFPYGLIYRAECEPRGGPAVRMTAHQLTSQSVCSNAGLGVWPRCESQYAKLITTLLRTPQVVLRLLIDPAFCGGIKGNRKTHGDRRPARNAP